MLKIIPAYLLCYSGLEILIPSWLPMRCVVPLVPSVPADPQAICERYSVTFRWTSEKLIVDTLSVSGGEGFTHADHWPGGSTPEARWVLCLWAPVLGSRTAALALSPLPPLKYCVRCLCSTYELIHCVSKNSGPLWHFQVTPTNLAQY